LSFFAIVSSKAAFLPEYIRKIFLFLLDLKNQRYWSHSEHKFSTCMW